MKNLLLAILMIAALPSLGSSQGLDDLFGINHFPQSDFVHYAQKDFRRHQLHIKDGVIAGHVYLRQYTIETDENKRKVRVPLPAVEMDMLLLNGDKVVAKSKTDSKGQYRFTKVPEGTFGLIGQTFVKKGGDYEVKGEVIALHLQVKHDATLEESETLMTIAGNKKPVMDTMEKRLDRVPTRANQPDLPVKQREGVLATTLQTHQITVQDVDMDGKTLKGVVYARIRAMDANGNQIIPAFTQVLLDDGNGNEYRAYTNTHSQNPEEEGVATFIGVKPGEYTITACGKFARQNGHDYDGLLACGVSIVECPPKRAPVFFEGCLTVCGDVFGEILVQTEVFAEEEFCEELAVGESIPCGGAVAGGGFCGGGGGFGGGGGGGFGGAGLAGLAGLSAALAAAGGGGGDDYDPLITPPPAASPAYPEPRRPKPRPPVTPPRQPPVRKSFNPNTGQLVPRTGPNAVPAVQPWPEPKSISPF